MGREVGVVGAEVGAAEGLHWVSGQAKKALGPTKEFVLFSQRRHVSCEQLLKACEPTTFTE